MFPFDDVIMILLDAVRLLWQMSRSSCWWMSRTWTNNRICTEMDEVGNFNSVTMSLWFCGLGQWEKTSLYGVIDSLQTFIQHVYGAITARFRCDRYKCSNCVMNNSDVIWARPFKSPVNLPLDRQLVYSNNKEHIKAPCEGKPEQRDINTESVSNFINTLFLILYLDSLYTLE